MLDFGFESYELKKLKVPENRKNKNKVAGPKLKHHVAHLLNRREWRRRRFLEKTKRRRRKK